MKTFIKKSFIDIFYGIDVGLHIFLGHYEVYLFKVSGVTYAPICLD
jgi:hypothetical protein